MAERETDPEKIKNASAYSLKQLTSSLDVIDESGRFSLLERLNKPCSV